MSILRAILGMVLMIAIAAALSTHRSRIPWRLAGIGLGLQLLFGVLVLRVDLIAEGFRWLSRFFVEVLSFADAGAKFLFGNLVKEDYQDTFGVIFAFEILPIIVFFSALTSALYYLGIFQHIIRGIAWVMVRTMRLTGAESLAAAGNVFIGQTEAPLLVKPFLSKMTRSELNAVMTGGMATIAGSVMAAFVRFLGGSDPQMQELFATHLLSASIMSAPAALVMAKILVPETETGRLGSELNIRLEQKAVNLLDALTLGTSDGLRLAVNVGAMLLAFIAVIAMLNAILMDGLGAATGLNAWVRETTDGQFEGFTLQYLFGQVFRPLAYLIGVDWQDSLTVGSLLGQKTVINEFIAYDALGRLPEGAISLKSKIISTYALCGFANFSSVAIQIGGLSSLAPNQRPVLSQLGLRALLGGTFASLLTAAIAGMLIT